MRNFRLILVFVSVIGLTLVGSAAAERITVALTATEVTAATPSNEALGDYYLVSVEIPEGLRGKRLVGAYLEVAVDVSARTVSDFTINAPTLEVHMLSEQLTGEANDSKVIPHSTMRRAVEVGENRSVRIDVTEAIKRFIDSPSDNHGLVIGSLRGRRDGLFELKNSGGALARITYLYMAQ